MFYSMPIQTLQCVNHAKKIHCTQVFERRWVHARTILWLIICIFIANMSLNAKSFFSVVRRCFFLKPHVNAVKGKLLQLIGWFVQLLLQTPYKWSPLSSLRCRLGFLDATKMNKSAGILRYFHSNQCKYE